MSAKRYIPILITIALLALIGLQGIWLFLVYQHKAQELNDKTREAVLETTKRLQKEEDSRYIIRNIDSLLVTDDIIASGNGPDMRVIVSNIKDKLRFDTLRIGGASHLEHQIRINGDSSTATTIVNIKNGKKQKIIVHSGSSQIELEKKHKGLEKEYAVIEKNYKNVEKAYENSAEAAKEAEKAAKAMEDRARELEKEEAHLQKISGKVKKKAGDLQALFLKMAIDAGDTRKDLKERINFEKLKSTLKEELTKQGIGLTPEVGVTYGSNSYLTNSLDFHVIFSTPGYIAAKRTDALPLFPDDAFTKNVFLSAGYLSTTSFVIKQMAGLLSLSLSITILIGLIMIFLFRRMLSQEKLHTMKNDFINNMTHELKTPIATISLAVDAISNPAVKNHEERFRNYTGILKEENKKLNCHVERVLQMAMLDKGETMLMKRSLDVKSIILNCVNTYRLQIRDRNAKIDLALQDNMITEGDEFHLTNAFTNLLDNSLKYSGGDPVISISAQKNGNIIVIRFSDKGIGIDTAEQEKVFDKFYRVQGGNLHDVKGFGLGLSYVRSIIESHEGTIELKSEKNKGSEFIIKLKAYET
jgi:two-component system, OmpR family, phosphate regulon sensor histidine kinase PhoR